MGVKKQGYPLSPARAASAYSELKSKLNNTKKGHERNKPNDKKAIVNLCVAITQNTKFCVGAVKQTPLCGKAKQQAGAFVGGEYIFESLPQCATMRSAHGGKGEQNYTKFLFCGVDRQSKCLQCGLYA